PRLPSFPYPTRFRSIPVIGRHGHCHIITHEAPLRQIYRLTLSKSPTSHSKTRQIAVRVVYRIARARLFFKIDRFAKLTPTFSLSSVNVKSRSLKRSSRWHWILCSSSGATTQALPCHAADDLQPQTRWTSEQSQNRPAQKEIRLRLPS